MSGGSLNILLGIYRRTLKRSRVAHRAMYGLSRRLLVRPLEARLHFYTPEEDPLYLRLNLLLGQYEPETTSAIKRLLRPGLTVIDVGAHVGYYARLAAEHVGANGHVIALEPNPSTFAMLSRNLASYTNATLIEAAASDQEGVALLYDAHHETGGSSLQMDDSKHDYYDRLVVQGELAPRAAGGLPVVTYSVRTELLDNLLADAGIDRVDIVKIDVEGAELSALRGMERTISASRPLWLIIEFNPTSLATFGVAPETFFVELFRLGFGSITSIDDQRGSRQLGRGRDDGESVATWATELAANFERVNLLCVKAN